MAEEKFQYLMKARILVDKRPWPDDIIDQLDAICKEAGETTPESRMIGILMSSVYHQQLNPD